MYLTYFNENKQRVPKVPYNTAWITVRVRVYLWRVTVCAGSGTVWENPTRGIPMFNPNLWMEPATSANHALHLSGDWSTLNEQYKLMRTFHWATGLLHD